MHVNASPGPSAPGTTQLADPLAIGRVSRIIRVDDRSERVPKDKWYKDGLNFTCTQCGNCCSGDPGYVWATEAEVAKVAQYIGHPDPRLDQRYLRRHGGKFSFVEKEGGDCVFLKRENGKTYCGIYPVRPLQCRTWPFWDELLGSRSAWDSAARRCPGMNRGEHYGFVRIEELRVQRTW